MLFFLPYREGNRNKFSDDTKLEGHLRYQSHGTSQGDSGWRTGLTGSSWSYKKRCRTPHLGRDSPGIRCAGRGAAGKQLGRKAPGGAGGTGTEHCPHTDSQKLSGHDAGQLAVGGPAWSMELDQVTSREPFRLHSICNSVLLWVITLWGEAEALVFNLVSEFWRKNGLRWKHFLHILLSKLKCAKGVMGHRVQLNTQGKAASQAL